ncbi:MAG TPA: PAS domain S-box protein, partial [Smithellaceae bacterium]|nr:PAS domain S-box protein [Smithellaceae bacterium]
MSDYRLSELLDLTIVQKMADAHYRAAGMPLGIIDAIDGSILVGSGWQDICVKFHRANPVSLQRCRESDDYIKNHLVEGEACHYKCQNGLWDIGMPIVVAGRHLATMFLGQFFYEGEAPDRGFFIKLAHELSFDVDEYLAALDRVPVFSREKVNYILEYNKALVRFINDLAVHALLKIEADKIIRENEREFHAIFDQTYQFLWLLSIDGRMLKANETALRFSGVEEADIIGKLFWETPWWAHSPELHENVRQAVQKAAKGEFIRFESTHFDFNRNLHYVDFSLKPVMDETGYVVMLLSEGRDITKRKQAEDSLWENERRLSNLMENLPGMAYRCMNDKDWTMAFVSAGCCVLLEYTPGDIINNKRISYNELIHPEDRQRVRDMVQASLSRKDHYIIEYRIHTASGKVKWVWEQGCGVFSKDGGLLALEGFITDITERKQMEQSLRESEGRLRTLLQTIPDLIWLKDAKGVYLSCNKMFERFFGAREEDIVGKTDYDFLEKDLADFFREHDRKAVAAGKPTSNEEWITFADDGHRAYLDTVKTPMFDVEGKLVGVLGISRDITERSRSEEEKTKLQGQLQQAQKMEAVGRLAGGVAHDFNNMLSVILGHAELSLGQMDPADPLFAALQEIRKAAEHSADLTRQLLAFARKQTIAPRVIDLNVTVENILKMLRRLIGEDIDLAWLPGARTWSLMADPSQIDQILANLCVNARDAIAGPGRVTIETDNATFDEAYCAEHPESESGDFVMLVVSDDGHG